MADRDSILADFQAFTGNENFDECILILKQHDWNLENAVQTVMASDIFSSPSPPPPSSRLDHVADESDYAPPAPKQDNGATNNLTSWEHLLTASSRSDAEVEVITETKPKSYKKDDGEFCRPSGSRVHNNLALPRKLRFIVEFQEQNLMFYLADDKTVERLKELIEEETDVPIQDQELKGWKSRNRRIRDTDLLSELFLPTETRLILLNDASATNKQEKLHSNGALDVSMTKLLNETYSLNIRFKDTDAMYNLSFPGSRSVQEIKQDMHAVINIPVRHQVWTGWPQAALDDDTITLAGMGLKDLSLDLEVCKCDMPQPRKPSLVSDDVISTTSAPVTAVRELDYETDGDSAKTDDTYDVEISDDEDYDAASQDLQDEMFSAEVRSQSSSVLMPENAQSQQEALESFQRVFSSRYGELHPVFYLGSLENAIKDALMCPAKERKLLAVYLHHDRSIQANVFCSQILCSESIVTYLSNFFITWAWDVTSDVNKSRFLTMSQQQFGGVPTEIVRRINTEQLPLLMVFTRTRGSNEVLQVSHGNATIDELLTELMQSQEQFQQQQLADIAEQEEREARQRVLAEQNSAYEVSLAADRAKAQAQRAQEERSAQEEARLKDIQQRKEAEQRSLAERIPAEPAADCDRDVSVIRIRMPDGTVVTRRFLADSKLQTLLDFVTSKGYHTEDYKVLTTFPRRDLKQSDSNKSLKDLKLFPQETVILEEI